jgi:hypothetical protein
VLPASGDPRHKLFPDGHFILPDTNVFLSQVCCSVLLWAQREIMKNVPEAHEELVDSAA